MFLSKRPNGVYHLYYEQPNGKLTSISTKAKLKSEAHKFLLDFSKKLKEQQTSKTIPIRLKEFLFEYLKYSESIHSYNTTLSIKSTTRAMFNYFGDIYVSALTNESISGYIRQRVSKASVYVGKREIAYLSGMLKWAIMKGYHTENIVKGIKTGKIPEKQPNYFTDSEFDRLLNVTADNDLRELFVFAVNTGLRQMELLTLKWKQINLSSRFVILDNREHLTKGKKVRTIPLNQKAMGVLNRRAPLIFSGDDLIFTYGSQPIKQQFISHKFKKLIKKAGLNIRLNFHSLRHTFATWLIQKGASIYEVSKLLGHADIKTTEIYSHINPEDLRSSIDLLNDSAKPS